MNNFDLFVSCEEIYCNNYKEIAEEIIKEEEIAKLTKEQEKFAKRKIFGVTLPNNETLEFESEKNYVEIFISRISERIS